MKIKHPASPTLTLPKTIPNLSDVVQISVGTQHTLFVKSDSTLWGCGWNIRHCLGQDLNRIWRIIKQ